MPKVVALHSPTGRLAEMLMARGYRVIDFTEASRPGVQVDAILSTGYNPDRLTATSLSEFADITIGTSDMSVGHRSPQWLNITGLNPEQAVNLLEQRLHRLL